MGARGPAMQAVAAVLIGLEPAVVSANVALRAAHPVHHRADQRAVIAHAAFIIGQPV